MKLRPRYPQIQSLPPATVKALQPILSDPNVTARQLLPAMATYVPAAYKAFSDAAGIGSTNATAAKTTAETAGIKQAQGIVAENQGTPAPTAVQPGTPNVSGGTSQPPQFSFRPGTNLAVMRATLAKNAPDALPAFDAQYPNVSQQTPASAPGPTPAPASTSAASAQAKLQQMVAGPTPAELAATRASLKGAAQPPSTNANIGPAIVEALNAGRVSPDEDDPAKLAEADTSQLSNTQLLQKKALESTDPQQIIKYNKTIANLTDTPYRAPMPLNITGVSGTSGATVGPSGLQSSNQASTGADIGATSHQLSVYNNGGKQAAQSALVNAGQGGPKPSNMIPVGNPAAQQLNNAVAKLNADAQALGVIAPQGTENTTGLAATAAGTAIAVGAPNGIARAGGAVLSGLGSLAGSAQAVTARSDPQTIAALAIQVQEVAAKKQMLLAQKQAFADKNNGDATQFVNSPVYKAIVAAKPLVNPKTGDVVVPVTNDQRIAYKKAGYGNASTFLGIQ